MKRITRLFFAAFVLSFAILFGMSAANGERGKIDNGSKSEQIIIDQYFPDDYKGYRYPIIPGTGSWNALRNHQQMVDACQIPEDVISEMTTSELIETIIAYPLYTDMYAYDNWDDGFEIVRQHFNGFDELESRKDMAVETVKAYAKLNPAVALRGDNGGNLLKLGYMSAMINYYRSGFSDAELQSISDLFKDVVESENIQLIPDAELSSSHVICFGKSRASLVP